MRGPAVQLASPSPSRECLDEVINGNRGMSAGSPLTCNKQTIGELSAKDRLVPKGDVDA